MVLGIGADVGVLVGAGMGVVVGRRVAVAVGVVVGREDIVTVGTFTVGVAHAASNMILSMGHR